jgi:hypothetical protein
MFSSLLTVTSAKPWVGLYNGLEWFEVSFYAAFVKCMYHPRIMNLGRFTTHHEQGQKVFITGPQMVSVGTCQFTVLNISYPRWILVLTELTNICTSSCAFECSPAQARVSASSHSRELDGMPAQTCGTISLSSW